jgi:hypothetical protein
MEEVDWLRCLEITYGIYHVFNALRTILGFIVRKRKLLKKVC